MRGWTGGGILDAMGARTRAALLAIMMVVAAAACERAEPAPAPTGASTSASVSASAVPFVAPPLRLPRVAPGGRCPVTAAHALPGLEDKVLGNGPLYPIAYYFMAGDAVLQLRPDDREPGGSYRVKVRWVGSGYAGPVLIRADRIDGTGTALAQFSYTGEARDGGYFATLTESENDLPATTLVSGPGCFAYQVDGTTFSETIVFEVVRAR